jgi:hypothetical protein
MVIKSSATMKERRSSIGSHDTFRGHQPALVALQAAQSKNGERSGLRVRSVNTRWFDCETFAGLNDRRRDSPAKAMVAPIAATKRIRGADRSSLYR